MGFSNELTHNNIATGVKNYNVNPDSVPKKETKTTVQKRRNIRAILPALMLLGSLSESRSVKQDNGLKLTRSRIIVA